MDYKIIQIIPAPGNMYSTYGQDDGTLVECSVVSLALCEEDDGYRFVTALDCFEDGEINDPNRCNNFVGIIFK